MYHINEGKLDIPADWQDRSVNIIASDNSPFQVSIAITRDNIAWGVAFPEYLEDQMERAEQALEGFKPLGRRDMVIGGIAAHEVESSWLRNSQPVHLLTTTFDMGQKALIITVSVDGQMSEGQKSRMREIVNSFQPGGAMA